MVSRHTQTGEWVDVAGDIRIKFRECTAWSTVTGHWQVMSGVILPVRPSTEKALVVNFEARLYAGTPSIGVDLTPWRRKRVVESHDRDRSLNVFEDICKAIHRTYDKHILQPWKEDWTPA